LSGDEGVGHQMPTCPRMNTSVTNVWIIGSMRMSGLIQLLCAAELLTRQETDSGSSSLNTNGQMEDGHKKRLNQSPSDHRGPILLFVEKDWNYTI